MNLTTFLYLLGLVFFLVGVAFGATGSPGVAWCLGGLGVVLLVMGPLIADMIRNG